MENNDWMSKFVMKKLPQYDSVKTTDSLDKGYLLIKRKKGDIFRCFCISSEEVTYEIIKRYFAPVTQIGIAPTKKRPFLLLGGGFSIPSARIAITGGPIWPWNQILDKITVGQNISSTTALEKDIQYKFDIQPKGWYLGIQYNF